MKCRNYNNMGVKIISYKNAYKDFKQTTSIQGIAEILQNSFTSSMHALV